MSNNVIRITDKLNVVDSNIVASSKATSELKNSVDSLSVSKVSKSGDTITGNLVVDGNVTVVGKINATIEGSAENAMSAVKDSNGNVIVDTYATKDSQTTLDSTLRALIAEEIAKLLPLDGSQPMTGSLQLPYSAKAESRRNDTYGTFIECSLGFHDDQGALVIARRKDSTAYDQAGMVGLKACDGVEIKYLLGYPNGKIQWDNKTILTAPDYARQIYGSGGPDVRITAAETSLVICWGSVNMINGAFTLVSPAGEMYTVGFYYDDMSGYSVGHSQTFICPAGWSFYAGVGFDYRIYPMGKSC